jgi:hypothetical protein
MPVQRAVHVMWRCKVGGAETAKREAGGSESLYGRCSQVYVAGSGECNLSHASVSRGKSVKMVGCGASGIVGIAAMWARRMTRRIGLVIAWLGRPWPGVEGTSGCAE